MSDSPTLSIHNEIEKLASGVNTHLPAEYDIAGSFEPQDHKETSSTVKSIGKSNEAPKSEKFTAVDLSFNPVQSEQKKAEDSKLDANAIKKKYNFTEDPPNESTSLCDNKEKNEVSLSAIFLILVVGGTSLVWAFFGWFLSWFRSRTEIKPIGFNNPKGFCFLNSVLQILYSCRDFVDQMKDTFKDKKSDIATVCALLFQSMENHKDNEIPRYVDQLQQFFKENEHGDDVHKCFMNLLTKINNCGKPISSNERIDSKLPVEEFFKLHKAKNCPLIFDNFYGLMRYETLCTVCKTSAVTHQLFKSIPLSLEKLDESVQLQTVYEKTFANSEIISDESICCENPASITITKPSHLPKYLFMYLNRGSYQSDGSKNNCKVNCNGFINIPVVGGKEEKYQLIATIDHTGDHEGGHYYCKVSLDDNSGWWLISDNQVDQMPKMRLKTAVKPNDVIAFMFKKIPQPSGA